MAFTEISIREAEVVTERATGAACMADNALSPAATAAVTRENRPPGNTRKCLAMSRIGDIADKEKP